MQILTYSNAVQPGSAILRMFLLALEQPAKRRDEFVASAVCCRVWKAATTTTTTITLLHCMQSGSSLLHAAAADRQRDRQAEVVL